MRTGRLAVLVTVLVIQGASADPCCVAGTCQDLLPADCVAASGASAYCRDGEACGASACDAAAIVPIDDLRLRRVGRDVVLTWSPDPNANVYSTAWDVDASSIAGCEAMGFPGGGWPSAIAEWVHEAAVIGASGSVFFYCVSAGCTLAAPTGACCIAVSCNVDITEADCTSGGGTWLGASTDCAGNPCALPRGACCMGATCAADYFDSDCLAGGGAWLGAGTDCAGQPCTAPSGVVYFNQIWEPGRNMHSMADDGANQRTLPCVHGDPSILLHGGKRWFLHVLAVPGELNNFGAERNDLFASREDGFSVRLTNDGGLNTPLRARTWQWGRDESATTVTVAGLSQRVAPDGSPETGSGGLYLATLRFDASGNVAGLDAPPRFVTSVGVRPGELPDAQGFSWSPDMTRIVADRVEAPTRLRIIEVPSGVETTLLDDPAHALRGPAWSPSGQRIAFTTSAAGRFTLDSILATGAGRVTLHLDRNYFLFYPDWSPDSSALVFEKFRFDNQAGDYLGEVYRVPASGGRVTNLTDTSALDETPWGWR